MKINIYELDIQKQIDKLSKEIDINSLSLYREYKPFLDEAYVESIIEYENLLTEYHIKEQEINSPLYRELEHIYNDNQPLKTVDSKDFYLFKTVN